MQSNKISQQNLNRMCCNDLEKLTSESQKFMETFRIKRLMKQDRVWKKDRGVPIRSMCAFFLKLIIIEYCISPYDSAWKCQVNPQFYAFRWITLLLTQEFNFTDSIHIWDTLLSDPEGTQVMILHYYYYYFLILTYFAWNTTEMQSSLATLQETLLRVCCAMLILVRRRLLAGDFTSNLKLLQHYPSTNINHLLYVANKLCSKPSG